MNPFPARRSTTLANLPASTPLWAFSALRIKAFDQPDRQKLVLPDFQPLFLRSRHPSGRLNRSVNPGTEMIMILKAARRQIKKCIFP
jgi:hypothetical protein